MPVFQVVLSGPASVAVGDAVPIAIEVHNISSDTTWMVGVLGGSEEGSRYPHYRPEVRFEGAVVAAPPTPEDPLVRPLRLTDFRSLAPGESFDPTARREGAAYLPVSTFENFRPDRPGTFTFSLLLSTESAAPEQWLGRFGQEDIAAVLARVERIPRVSLASNILSVRAVRRRGV